MYSQETQRTMLKLNLVCGPDKKEGYIGVDKIKAPTVDIVHDLNSYPYPFEDNSVDEVYCSHVLEHLDDFIKTMEELWRICKPGALIIVKGPYYKHKLAYGDPTHKHFFTEHTFDVFSDRHPLHVFYTHAKFKIREIKLKSARKLRFLPFKSFLNTFLWNIFSEIEFKLIVEKDNCNNVPTGDKGVPGERDDMCKPQISSRTEKYQHLQRYMYAIKRIGSRKKVLDIGCGTGYGTKMIFDKGNETYGLDISEAAINYAQKKYPGPKYVCCSAEKIPFPNNYFDAITAFEVIEHVQNPEKMLEEIYRVLKENGDLFISTPNPRHMARRIKHLLFKRPFPEKLGPNIYHIKEFYYEEFIEILKKKKFKIKFKYGQNLTIFPSLILKFIEKLPGFYKIPIIIGYPFPKFSSTVVVWAKK